MKEEEKNTEVKDKKEIRIVVSHEAETAITEMTDKVNEDFEAGKASRYDVASFMILWFKSNAPSDAILEIRRRSANAFSMLDALHKKYKAIGELPPDVQAVLDKHFFGDVSRDLKKPKKNLKQGYITDIHNESESI